MSDFRIDKITNRVGDAGTQIAGITTFSGTSGMQLPVGPTEYRGGRGRGVFGSGATPTATTVLDMIEIATTGNSTDFGDDTLVRQEGNAAFASPTRGCFGGGLITPSPGADTTNIAYVTISSQGGASDFGTLSVGVERNPGLSDSTRGLSSGGLNGPLFTNLIEYVTIATTGDASEFGELTKPLGGAGACASPTRGLIGGGWYLPASPYGYTNIIDYVTIQSKGNAQEFGNLTETQNSLAGCSNSIRGLFMGGQTPTNTDTIGYVTIATLGNAIEFGEIIGARDYLGACASATRGISAGGQTPTKMNTIDYVTIATTGDAVDFGDLTVARRFCQGLSDVHGGLG